MPASKALSSASVIAATCAAPISSAIDGRVMDHDNFAVATHCARRARTDRRPGRPPAIKARKRVFRIKSAGSAMGDSQHRPRSVSTQPDRPHCSRVYPPRVATGKSSRASSPQATATNISRTYVCGQAPLVKRRAMTLMLEAEHDVPCRYTRRRAATCRVAFEIPAAMADDAAGLLVAQGALGCAVGGDYRSAHRHATLEVQAYFEKLTALRLALYPPHAGGGRDARAS